MKLKRRFLFLLALMLAFTGAACAREARETAPETTVTVPTAAPAAAEPTTVPATVPEETEPQEERFLLTFVGDCTLGSNPVNYYADCGFIKIIGEDYGHPFRNVLPYFTEDEVTMINLEGPLTDKGNPMAKTHTFRGPTDYVNILTHNSVEFATLANNHTHDYGQIGYDSTLETLNSAGIPYVERDASAVFTTKNGLTIGIYGAVYYLLDAKVITAEIAALKEQGCDLVIFAPHWGIEGNYKPTQDQVNLGHAAIDAGADIVWGSHPHVLQPIEAYNGGVILYSLGNFSFGGNIYPTDLDTALIQQEVIRTADGAVSLGERIVVPASVSSIAGLNNFQPTPYGEDTEEYARVLSKLEGSFDGPNAYGF